MAEEVQKYKLVNASSTYELVKAVNKYLNSGWILHGDTFVEDGIWYQPMIVTELGKVQVTGNITSIGGVVKIQDQGGGE